MTTCDVTDAPEMREVVGRDDAATCQEPGPEGEGAVRDDGVVAQRHHGKIVADAKQENQEFC